MEEFFNFLAKNNKKKSISVKFLFGRRPFRGLAAVWSHGLFMSIWLKTVFHKEQFTFNISIFNFFVKSKHESRNTSCLDIVQLSVRLAYLFKKHTLVYYLPASRSITIRQKAFLSIGCAITCGLFRDEGRAVITRNKGRQALLMCKVQSWN